MVGGVDFGKDYSYVECYVGINRKSTDDRFKVHDHDSRVVISYGNGRTHAWN